MDAPQGLKSRAAARRHDTRIKYLMSFGLAWSFGGGDTAQRQQHAEQFFRCGRFGRRRARFVGAEHETGVVSYRGPHPRRGDIVIVPAELRDHPVNATREVPFQDRFVYVELCLSNDGPKVRRQVTH